MARQVLQGRSSSNPFRVLILLSLVFGSVPAQASYFGINTLDQSGEDWHIYQTEHLKIHLYGSMRSKFEVICDAAERSYQRAAQVLDHDPSNTIPVFIYPSPALFQETNIIQGPLGEGVGGFTEAFKNRVAVPYTGSMDALEKVLSHELSHAIQFSMLYGDGLRSFKLVRSVFVPYWVSEGLAEYVSQDWDPVGKMVLRDAVLNDLLVSMGGLSSFAYLGPRTYLAYKQSQSIMEFIVKEQGEKALSNFMKKFIRQWTANQIVRGIFAENSENPLTGESELQTMGEKDLYKAWQREQKDLNWKLAVDRSHPSDYGPRVGPQTRAGHRLSGLAGFVTESGQPWLAYLSNKKGYTDIFVEPLGKGKARSILGHRFDSIRGGGGALALSPEGDRIAVCPKIRGKYQLMEIIDTRPGGERPFRKTELKKHILDLEEVKTPAYLPDGRLVLAGQKDLSWSLYIFDPETASLEAITSEREMVHSPLLLPDGKAIIYSVEEGVTKSINKVHLASGEEEVVFVHPTLVGGATLSPSGNKIAFSAAIDEVPDLYIMDLESHELVRATHLRVGALMPTFVVTGSGLGLAYVTYNKLAPSIYINTKLSDSVSFEIPGLPKPLALLQAEKQSKPDQRSDLVQPPSKILARPGNRSVILSWESPLDNQHSGYKIYRSTDAETWQKIHETQTSNETAYLDKDLQNGTRYAYGIAATKKEHEGALSETVWTTPRLQIESKRYKSRLSPDLMIVLAGFDSHAGIVGAGLVTLSDMLGDNRISITGDAIPEYRKGGMITYSSLGARLDWGISIFAMENQFLILDLSQGGIVDQFREKQVGATLFARYPLDRWHRIEASLDFRNLSGEILEQRGLFSRDLVDDLLLTGNVRSLSLGWVREKTIGGGFNPIGGSRAYIDFVGAQPIAGGNVSYFNSVSNIQWFRALPFFRPAWVVAIRSLLAGSSGTDRVKYYLGGDGTLRGYRFGDVRGSLASAWTAEIRAPLLDPIRIALWPLQFIVIQEVKTAIFVDAVWAANDFGQFGWKRHSLGAGGGLRFLLFLFGRYPVLLRLDLARRTDVKSKGILHISLGNSF